jgi:hypothetical protein
MPANKQADYADRLTENLEECGHDIGTLDLLDCLASVGLQLEAIDEGKENLASEAYFQMLADGARR